MRDLKTADFDFDLPADRIAQTALEPRDHARLLHVTPSSLTNRHVFDLPDLLKAGDVLVINDTRVIPARIYGIRQRPGAGKNPLPLAGKVREEGVRLDEPEPPPNRNSSAPLPPGVKTEFLLHKKAGPSTWQAFARPGKRLRVGDVVRFTEAFSAEILDKREGGDVLIRFNVPDEAVLSLLHAHGEPPLPPYIKRETGATEEDKARYQTVYAKRDGAVAAPTAGLHFTPGLLDALAAKGIDCVHVTLHVGAGTFLPVKVENIKDHVMHAEWGEISKTAAEKLNKAHAEGRRIVCVGTTSLRVLESAADENGVIHPFSTETSIFITPGYRFRAADVLITNFHLPQSTLFMLVSAFMGLETMQKAYAYAIKENYRFYSYGDASLLERRP